ncbi:hypothetical protein LINGRAHAP2_LOCUS4369, partial [Linum grandiflorum]
PGHLQNNCKKRNFCNYCKKTGHIILECTSIPPKGNGGRRNSRTVYAATDGFGPAATSQSTAGVSQSQINTMVQLAIQQALPVALQSAFSATTNTGSEDGEGDRKRS